LLINCK